MLAENVAHRLGALAYFRQLTLVFTLFSWSLLFFDLFLLRLSHSQRYIYTPVTSVSWKHDGYV